MNCTVFINIPVYYINDSKFNAYIIVNDIVK